MSNLAKKVLEKFSDEDKAEIKSWAESAFVIRNDESLSELQKIKKLYEISSEKDVIKRFIKAIYEFVKKVAWDERSIPARGAIIGAVLGGSKMVGIATAGFGVGMPLFLLTGVGGAFLGVLIKEIDDAQKKNKK